MYSLQGFKICLGDNWMKMLKKKKKVTLWSSQPLFSPLAESPAPRGSLGPLRSGGSRQLCEHSYDEATVSPCVCTCSGCWRQDFCRVEPSFQRRGAQRSNYPTWKWPGCLAAAPPGVTCRRGNPDAWWIHPLLFIEHDITSKGVLKTLQ